MMIMVTEDDSMVIMVTDDESMVIFADISTILVKI